STLARGFKSGGFNGRPQNRPALDPFDPETLLSWEVGAKADLLDRRLRLNAAAFWSDYEDIHFAASLEVNGQAVFVTQNAGDAEIWGFETELQAYLAPTFLVTTSVGHVSSELTRLDPRVPPGTVDLGNMLPRTPEWTWALSGQKTWIVSGGRALIGRFDYSWRSETFQDFSNSPTVVQDDYGLLGARLLYSPASGKWDLALFGTNLTDEQYLEAGFFAAAFGASIGIPARPREWGLTATLRY
ncbi:MAG: TonB-dependent receptor, partial [Holophagales bacterium]|nr:TonB-dependent receptor [Holophagales bacterium]